MRLTFLVLIKSAYPMVGMFSYGFAGFNAGLNASKCSLTHRIDD